MNKRHFLLNLVLGRKTPCVLFVLVLCLGSIAISQSNRALKQRYYDVCCVGAGLSGSVLAERFANVLNQSVLVMDVRNHVGGNTFDYVDRETGILMNKYGAHLFHTNLEHVWKYINSFPNSPKWSRWDHQVLGYVQQKLVPIPVNINTVNALFNLNISNQLEMKTWLSLRQIPCPHTGCSNAEEMAKSRVGVQLYEEIFKDYTLKQWDKQPSELDSLVTSRIPVRTDFDNRYFTDRYQALPEKGYTKWIESVLDHPNIEILLKEDFFKKQKIWESNCGKIFFTGPIDRYFSSVGFPMLEYRGIDFKVKKHFNSGFIQTASVINYPGARFPFTRIVEYKHFLNQPSPNSVTVAEYSKTMGPYDDPYYPVPTTRNHALYKKYQKLATELENEKNIFFIGRLANYKYFNMDETISNALKLFYSLSKVPCDFCPIPRESSRN